MAGSADWKLHVKEVPTIDLDAVKNLEGGAKSLNNFLHVVDWLKNDRKYDGVCRRTARGAPTTSMPAEWIEQLLRHGVIDEIQRNGVRGWVNMFAVPEPAKKRFRPIKHTRDANIALGKDTLMKLRFPTKQEICRLVHKGSHFIALDFAAYYDQFKYAPEVGARFCFRHGGRYFRLSNLAMGQRQAVEVAQCTTERFLDFNPSSTTASIIDNVIFVGSREEVIRDATTFISRVLACGGKLNEDVTDVEALVKTVGDWGGINLDFTVKTACLAQKTVDKTGYSWMNRRSWTWRQFAAHIGLLFWSWQLIHVPMAEYFPLLRFISAASSWLTANEALWDTPAHIWESAWPALEQWTLLVLRNRPMTVATLQEPEWLVATDASFWGWGYYAVHNVTGAVRTFGAGWSAGFRRLCADRLQHSTFTEPQAIINALCHLLDPTSPSRVRVLTDNTVARASFHHGYNARSYHINECLRRLHTIFGAEFSFDFAYLPGEFNPADAFSRGSLIAMGEVERDQRVSAELRRIAGSAECPRELGLAARASQLANTSR